MNMRLADFIRAEMEPILQDWEEFAMTILPAWDMDKTELRDHAREMLLNIANDLEAHQSESEQAAKSKGLEPDDEKASSADLHGGDRQASGFNVMEALSEFRALRASVVSLWTKDYPRANEEQREDLTRFHEAIDQALAESMEQYSTAKERETRLFGAFLNASPNSVFVLDLEGRFVYANKTTSSLFALEPEVIVGKTTFDLGFPFASELQHNLEKVVAEQSTYRGTLAHTFASGRGERFDYLLAPVLDERQRTETTICILRDITEQALAEEKIWHAAHHDLLTGLPNRRLLLDRLDQAVKHAKRSNQPIYLLFMDLDGFKDVNDSFGHEAGDDLLREVAERLAECVREEDTVARMGGDEFTVIVTGAEKREDVEVVAQSIRDAFETPFQVADRPVHASFSIGIASYPDEANSSAELLDAADRAMYEAKSANAEDEVAS